ncbi:phosphoglycerate mutase [Caenimonas terrae]|uniref:Phosphoglycerate mutase n=1 Tax=Caenimonas terrae TaxID=696074 RepID=A0ABW0NCV9_9BURK
MSDGAHLLIPFAASPAPGCREALQQLQLPQLKRLLQRLAPGPLDDGDERDLSPPHERVLARACGLSAPDGAIPWAAWQVLQDGGDPAGQAWAWITPCHWHVATDHIVMKHPRELGLDGEDSSLLLAAMQPFFAQDGITLEYHAPTRWLARGELFRGLATASLDRVLNRDIDDWVPRAAAAAPLRRLQQEMQMLLYTHPVNDARVRGGLLPVNSFWASGTGALPADHRAGPPAGLLLPHTLRDAALLQDWSAWSAAWQQVDAAQCRQLNDSLDRGAAVTLSLCGEARARSWSGQASGWLRRLRGALDRQPLTTIFETL